MGRFIPKLQSLLDVFLKGECPLCKRSITNLLCLDCERQIKRHHVSNVTQFWQGELPIFAWGVYSGGLKRAIAALKYEHQPQLARPLGHWMGEAWRSTRLISQRPIVVPIPMHPDKQKKRGFNQAELLAKGFCAVTRLPLCADGLVRCRSTEAQFGLSVADREQNLADAFELGASWQRRQPESPILLLDDIYTTGATARSAAAVLTQRGIAVTGIVALAIALKENSPL